MLDAISQVIIVVCGLSGAYLVGSQKPNLRFYGALCGLLAEPAWFYTGIANEQWGIIILSFLYTYLWGLAARKNYTALQNA